MVECADALRRRRAPALGRMGGLQSPRMAQAAQAQAAQAQAAQAAQVQQQMAASSQVRDRPVRVCSFVAVCGGLPSFTVARAQ